MPILADLCFAMLCYAWPCLASCVAQALSLWKCSGQEVALQDKTPNMFGSFAYDIFVTLGMGWFPVCILIRGFARPCVW